MFLFFFLFSGSGYFSEKISHQERPGATIAPRHRIVRAEHFGSLGVTDGDPTFHLRPGSRIRNVNGTTPLWASTSRNIELTVEHGHSMPRQQTQGRI